MVWFFVGYIVYSVLTQFNTSFDKSDAISFFDKSDAIMVTLVIKSQQITIEIEMSLSTCAANLGGKMDI